MIITDKQKILKLFKENVESKIFNLKLQIEDLTEDAQNDAKGSAGDKHETTLSMMHLEQEKLNTKLIQLNEQLHTISNIKTDVLHNMIGFGSLFETSKGWFFISEAIQPIIYNEQTIVPMSISAPIYKNLKGKKINEEIVFNHNTLKIKLIL